ncbi:MAG: CorA family divalent cation transporter [Methylococcales bacterium]|nr:CorA family divalent cation transporter [Methylococcales bacterium]
MSDYNEPNSNQETILNVRGVLARHRLVEELVRKQNLVELQRLLEQLDANAMAQMLEIFSPEDREIIWSLIAEERKEAILLAMSYEIRVELAADFRPRNRNMVIRIFDLHEGLLRQIPIETKADLTHAKPIWIDLVMPEDEHLNWVKDIFGVDLPNPNELTDLETSARFYIEDNGEVHLHSDFLLDRKDESRNVAVAFVLKKDTLFSVRSEELPAFRLQRLRARAESDYISDSKDLLLDLYAADVEYSANALEDIYTELESVGRQVFKSYMTDEEAAKILAAIAEEEDLNGRIRRNVLDTRRALSFLMRGKFLSVVQHEDVREILRDIESLDGHTSFLFNKINFQLDATVGFINVNQNKDIKRLTVISLVFMPLNVIAGIGGMSEFSMMTQGIPWQIAYGCFGIGMAVVSWLTFHLVQFFERRKVKRLAMENRKVQQR